MLIFNPKDYDGRPADALDSIADALEIVSCIFSDRTGELQLSELACGSLSTMTVTMTNGLRDITKSVSDMTKQLRQSAEGATTDHREAFERGRLAGITEGKERVWRLLERLKPELAEEARRLPEEPPAQGGASAGVYPHFGDQPLSASGGR